VIGKINRAITMSDRLEGKNKNRERGAGVKRKNTYLENIHYLLSKHCSCLIIVILR